jgi:Nucleoside diphosphate kinase
MTHPAWQPSRWRLCASTVLGWHERCLWRHRPWQDCSRCPAPGTRTHQLQRVACRAVLPGLSACYQCRPASSAGSSPSGIGNLSQRDAALLALGAVAAVTAGVAVYRYWQACQLPELTLAMIKPDAVEAGHAEAIEQAAKQAGFAIVGRREYTLTAEQACFSDFAGLQMHLS